MTYSQKVSQQLVQPKQPCIINFVGPVGVGKSTNLTLLRNYLKLRQIRVSTTFIKSSHGLAYMFSRLLLTLVGYEIAQANPEKTLSTSKYRHESQGKIIVKKLLPLWCFLDQISILTKFVFTVFLPSSLGFTVLVEEGLPMTLFTYKQSFPLFFGTEPREPRIILLLMGYVTSRNHLNIVLDANDQELALRRGTRNFRQHEVSEYVFLQREWTRKLNPVDTVFLNTSAKSVLEVHQSIIKGLRGKSDIA